MRMAYDSTPPRALAWLLVPLGAIAVLIGWDLLSDYGEGVDPLHVAIESLVLVLAGATFAFVLAILARNRRQLRSLRTRLASARTESRRWRHRYQDTIRGLSEAIQEQFERWELTAAEAEIALLLLKGLSLREIADARGTGERTVREQARSVYRKAGLSGRSELSAFFMEDLLLPDPDAMAANDTRSGS